MDNFDLRKYLAEGKLHENVNQDEKSQLMDFVKNLQDVFSSGDIQYPIFVDSLDPELYADGSDLIRNFVKYLSHKYSYDEVTPLELDGGDVEDFLRSKFNEINEEDHSLDMVLNEMVNEGEALKIATDNEDGIRDALKISPEFELDDNGSSALFWNPDGEEYGGIDILTKRDFMELKNKLDPWEKDKLEVFDVNGTTIYAYDYREHL